MLDRRFLKVKPQKNTYPPEYPFYKDSPACPVVFLKKKQKEMLVTFPNQKT